MHAFAVRQITQQSHALGRLGGEQCCVRQVDDADRKLPQLPCLGLALRKCEQSDPGCDGYEDQQADEQESPKQQRCGEGAFAEASRGYPESRYCETDVLIIVSAATDHQE